MKNVPESEPVADLLARVQKVLEELKANHVACHERAEVCEVFFRLDD